jgi:hypothetical protein
MTYWRSLLQPWYRKYFRIMTLCLGYGGPAGGGEGGEEDGGLEVNIPGIPGQDYPIYSEVSEPNRTTPFTRGIRTELPPHLIFYWLARVY